MASREFWDDFKWGHQHHTELLKEHKDEWVAITNKQVVSSGKNLAEVERKARKKMKIPTTASGGVSIMSVGIFNVANPAR